MIDPFDDDAPEVIPPLTAEWLEQQLDEALRESFPASDPPAMASRERRPD